MNLDSFRTDVVEGIGAIGRWESGVVVCSGTSNEEAADLLASILESTGAEPTSGKLVECIRADPLADVAAIISAPDGLRLMVAGSMDARGVDNRSMAGQGLTEKTLPTDTAAIWIGRGQPPASAGHPVMNLRRGVVQGEGVVVYRHGDPSTEPSTVSASVEALVAATHDTDDPTSLSARPVPPSPPSIDPAQQTPGPPLPPDAGPPPAPPRQPEPVVASAPATLRPPLEHAPTTSRPDAAPFEAIDWSASGLQRREPLPVVGPEAAGSDQEVETHGGGTVLGIRCSRDHFNNPKASYCQVCGISMIHLTHRLEPGPRPTLGFMVFDDGATYAVDRPYVLGRNPMAADDTETALAIDDAQHSVSREHARIQIDGWDLQYVDLGSTNGSFVWDREYGRWNPIAPNTPFPLETGCTVSVGRKTFVFEAASRAVGG